MDRIIRNSAKALVIRDGKMLAVKLKDSDGEKFHRVDLVFSCEYIGSIPEA